MCGRGFCIHDSSTSQPVSKAKMWRWHLFLHLAGVKGFMGLPGIPGGQGFPGAPGNKGDMGIPGHFLSSHITNS